MGKLVPGCGGAHAIELASPSKPSPGVPDAAGRNYAYQLNFLPSYGQSLSLGFYGTPPISTAQRFDSLMFAGGTRPLQYSSETESDYGSAVPLIEDSADFTAVDPYARGPAGETPLSGITEAVKELMESEDNLTVENFPKYRFLGSCSGHGSYHIKGLIQGTPVYDRLLSEVTAAKAIAQDMGLTFGVPVVTWMQGEADVGVYSTEGYASVLTTLIADLNADIMAISGQTSPPVFLMYQTADPVTDPHGSLAVAYAQYLVSQNVPTAHIATPCYPFQTSNSPHLTALGYKLHGAYFGAAFKKIAINGEAWQPLSPQIVSVDGPNILVRLNVPHGPVVADTINVTNTNPAKAAYGFVLYDAAGQTIDIDGAVSITQDNDILIRAGRDLKPGFMLNYGDLVDGTGGGNIRDSQGDAYIFNGGGLNYPMHNWLVVFSYTF